MSASSTNEVRECEVCGNAKLESVLDLGLHPMCDDLIRIGEARVCREYPLEVMFCDRCVTAHQRFQVPKRELFPSSYHYRSRFTADVLNGMSQLVDACAGCFGGLESKLVVDVGCNDGSLLDFFKERGARTIGIEPTNACADAHKKGHIVFDNYISKGVAETVVAQHGHPDFITFTNVFAHIEDLREVLKSVATLMSSKTVLVIENHYLGAVLERNQFDTFYHEHVRSYSYTSFSHIAQALGSELLHLEFPSRYGGNIRVFMGQGPKISSVDADLRVREGTFLGRFETLRGNIQKWRENKRHELEKLVEPGQKIRAKAFPGRAAILVKMLGLTDASIAAVYEKSGSLKIGHYVPGTRIPILSEEDLFSSTDTTQPLLNFAWHISDEIRRYVSARGYSGPVVDILSAQDFLA